VVRFRERVVFSSMVVLQDRQTEGAFHALNDQDRLNSAA